MRKFVLSTDSSYYVMNWTDNRTLKWQKNNVTMKGVKRNKTTELKEQMY